MQTVKFFITSMIATCGGDFQQSRKWLQDGKTKERVFFQCAIRIRVIRNFSIILYRICFVFGLLNNTNELLIPRVPNSPVLHKRASRRTFKENRLLFVLN